MGINILSMDGGGPFTLVSLWMLRRIQEECARRGAPDFLSSADILCGTSAGGANALFMAAAPSRQEGLDRAAAVWDANPLKTELCRAALATAGCVSVYGNETLKSAYEPVLAGQTLGELAEKGQFVVVPTFRLKAPSPECRFTWKPKIFNNFYPDDPDLGELALDVAMRTCAAPVFFPTYQGFVDGGLYCSNPSMCGLCQVMAALPPEMEDRDEEIRLLSVGIGMESSFADAGDAAWGWQRWVVDIRRPLTLLEATMDAHTMATDFQCKAILKERFFRLNPPIVSESEVDSLDLEDIYISGSSPLWSHLKKVLRRNLGLDHPTREPEWLTGALRWLEEVGWFEGIRAKPARRNAKRRPRRDTKKS